MSRLIQFMVLIALATVCSGQQEQMSSLRFLPPGTEVACFFDNGGYIEEGKQKVLWNPSGGVTYYQSFGGARGVVKGERTPTNAHLLLTNVYIKTVGAVALTYYYTNTAAYSYICYYCEDVTTPTCGDSDYTSFGLYVDAPGKAYLFTDDIAESIKRGDGGFSPYFYTADNTVPASQWNRIVMQWNNATTNMELWVNGSSVSLTKNHFIGTGPTNHYDYVISNLGLLGYYSLGTGPTVNMGSKDGMLGYFVIRNGAWWTPAEIRRMTLDGLE